MQVKNTKLNQECEQLSSVKEHLSLQNQQSANELKVHIHPLLPTVSHFRVCKKDKKKAGFFLYFCIFVLYLCL